MASETLCRSEPNAALDEGGTYSSFARQSTRSLRALITPRGRLKKVGVAHTGRLARCAALCTS